jgi:hypothetical protein
MRFSIVRVLLICTTVLLGGKHNHISAENPVCNICGDGGTVGNPDAIVTIPTQADQPCSFYVERGSSEALLIDVSQCSLLQGFTKDPCECTTSNTTTTPTVACPICGEGKVVTNPDGVISVAENVPSTTCQALDDAAQAGAGLVLTELLCTAFQVTAKEPCGCVAADSDSDGAFSKSSFIISMLAGVGVAVAAL